MASSHYRNNFIAVKSNPSRGRKQANAVFVIPGNTIITIAQRISLQFARRISWIVTPPLVENSFSVTADFALPISCTPENKNPSDGEGKHG